MTLGTALIHMQIDIGFGDVVYPEPEMAELASILDYSAPRLLCYSRESAVAEKFEAMVKLGMLNSRMKDFYDIWLLARQFDFDGPELTRAVRLVFDQRKTALPAAVAALTKPFADSKQDMWSAFRDRIEQEQMPTSFAQVSAVTREFLTPVVATLVSGKPGPMRWTASGPWT